MMIVLRIRGMRLPIIFCQVVTGSVVMMPALAANMFGGIVILGGIVIMATIR